MGIPRYKESKANRKVLTYVEFPYVGYIVVTQALGMF